MAKKLKTKLDDIRKLSDADLVKEIEEAHRRLFSMRLQRETRQLTNYQELPKMKRHIARLKTIRRQRELSKAAAGEGARR
jgi:large subunit ribosomal protein L29